MDYIETIQLEPNAWKADRVPFRWRMKLVLADPTRRDWADLQSKNAPYLQVDHYDHSFRHWQPAVFLWRAITEDYNFFWFMHRSYPLNEYTAGAYGGKYKLVDGRTVEWAGGWSSNEDHFREVTGMDLINTTVGVGQYSTWCYVRKLEVERFIDQKSLPMKFIPDKLGGEMLVPEWFSSEEDDL